jgi:hypothetical protein
MRNSHSKLRRRAYRTRNGTVNWQKHAQLALNARPLAAIKAKRMTMADERGQEDRVACGYPVCSALVPGTEARTVPG